MVDPDVKLKGSFYRTKEQSENAGITMGDNMRTNGWEGVGDGTLAEYVKFMKETMPDHAGNDAFEDIPNGYGKTVDVSGRDMTHLDGVDEALGLVGKRNNKTLTKFEEIRDKVKTFEQTRDKNMAATGALEVCGKIMKEAFGGDDVDDENEKENEEQRWLWAKTACSRHATSFESRGTLSTPVLCIGLSRAPIDGKQEAQSAQVRKRNALIRRSRCQTARLRQHILEHGALKSSSAIIPSPEECK